MEKDSLNILFSYEDSNMRSSCFHAARFDR